MSSIPGSEASGPSTTPRSARSATRMRLAVTSVLALSIAIAFVEGSPDGAYPWILWGLVLSGVPMLLAVTELEALPAKARVPRRPWLAFLVAPWLPGGGRGALFLVLHLAAVYATILFLDLQSGEPTTRVFHVRVTCLFATIYTLLPCALAAPIPDTPARRKTLRIAIPSFMIGCWVVSAFFGRPSHDSFEGFVPELVNPWVLGERITARGRYVGHPASPTIVSAVAALAILGNAPRIVRGVREVIGVSARI